MPDIIIVGGLAVLPTGPETVDIGVDRGRIVAIGAPGSLAGGANRTIDASGKIVIRAGSTRMSIAAGRSSSPASRSTK
jgi:cytosine/adenosine deaminase-related metal-dependent hydrolase